MCSDDNQSGSGSCGLDGRSLDCPLLVGWSEEIGPPHIEGNSFSVLMVGEFELLKSVLETGISMRNSALAEVYSRSPPKLEGEILIVAELGLCILNDLVNNK